MINRISIRKLDYFVRISPSKRVVKMPETHTPRVYIHSFDGLRAIAVTLVILFHFGRLSFIELNFEIGWVGVQFFFVLSGFLITTILLSQKKSKFTSYLLNFYGRRTLRIFPLYFGFLILIVILFYLTHEPADFTRSAAYLFTYTYNYSVLSPEWTITRLYVHLWSLSVEEQFYLIWPFVIYFLSEKQFKFLISLLVLACPLLRLASHDLLNSHITDPEQLGTSIYWLTFNHFDAFAIGGFISFLREDFLGLSRKKWLVLSLFILIVAGGANAYSLKDGTMDPSSLGYPTHNVDNYQYIWSYTILNIFFASLIWNLAGKRNGVLSSKPLSTIGKVSYGMYVIHFPVLVVVESIFRGPVINDFLTLLVSFLVIFVLALLSYVGFERRFLKLKDRYFRR